jgi:uncharacterized protein (TIGR00369 family)
MTPAEAIRQRVQDSLDRQGMMLHLGVRLLQAEPGLCVVALPYSGRVTQQQGGFHGGAMGALAEDGRETACALMQQTLVPVPKTY